MTVETLRTLLGMMPANAEVVFIHDGRFRNDICFLGYTNDGLVRLVSRQQDINGHPLILLSTESAQPAQAPTV